MTGQVKWPEVGKAYVTVIPSMSNFQKAIRDTIGHITIPKKALAELGKKSAETLARSMRASLTKAMKNAGLDAGRTFAFQFRKGVRQGLDGKLKLEDLVDTSTLTFMSELDLIDMDAITKNLDDELDDDEIKKKADSKAYDIANGFYTSLRGALQKGTSALSGAFNFATKALSTFATPFIAIGKTMATAVASGIKTSYSTVFSTIKTLSSTAAGIANRALLTAFRTVGSTMLSVGRAVGSAILNGIKSSFSAVGSTMLSVGKQVGSAITSGIRTAFTSVGSLIKNIASSQIAAAGRALGIDLGKGIQNGLSSMKIAIGNVISNIVSSVSSMVTSQIGSAVDRLDTLKNFPRIMKGLGIAEQDSAAAVQAMSDSIDGLPTALNDIVVFAQKIVPAFDNNMDLATQSAIAFNNALVAGGRGAELQANALEQWSQMLSIGKVDMQAWRSVVNAMPAQMQQLAKSMGKNSPMELYESLVGSRNGKTPLSELNEMFIQLNEQGYGDYLSFAEQAKTATNGIGTAVTNLRNRISKALAEILDWIGQENISGAINNATKQFVPLAKAATQFMDRVNLKGYFSAAADVIARFANTMSRVLSPLTADLEGAFGIVLKSGLTLLGNTLSSIASQAAPLVNELGHVIRRLPAIVGVITPVIHAFIGFKINVWTSALQTIQRSLSSIMSILPGLLNATLKIYHAVFDTVEILINRLSYTVLHIYTIISDLVSFMAPFIVRIITALAPTLTAMVSDIATIAAWVTAIATPIIEDLAPVLTSLVHIISSSLLKVIKSASRYVEPIVGLLADVVSSVVTVGADLAVDMLPVVKQLFDMTASLVKSVLPVISSSIETLAPIFVTIYQQIIKIITALSNQLGPTLSKLQPILIGMFNDVGDGLVGAIQTAGKYLEPMAESLASIVSSVITIGGELLTNLSPIVSDLFNSTVTLVNTLLPYISKIIQNFAPVFVAICDSIIQIANVIAPILANIQTGGLVNAARSVADAVTSIVTTLQPFIPQIIDLFDNYIKTWFGTFVPDTLSVIAPYIIGVIDRALQFIDTIDPFITRIVEALGPTFELIVEQIFSFFEQIAGIAADLAEQSGPDIHAIFETIGATVSELISILAPYLPTIISAIRQIVDALAPAIVEIVRVMAPHIPKLTQLFVDASTKFADAIVKTFKEAIEPNIDELIEFADELITWITDNMPGFVSDVMDLWVNYLQPMFGKIGHFVDVWGPHIMNVLKWASYWVGEIFDFVAKIGEWLEKIDEFDFASTPFGKQFTESSTPSVRPFATGGIVTQPVLAMIGEASYPEAVVPLTPQGIESFTSGINHNIATGVPSISIEIDNFINQDTTTDVRTLSDMIGRQTLNQLKQQGVY